MILSADTASSRSLQFRVSARLALLATWFWTHSAGVVPRSRPRETGLFNVMMHSRETPDSANPGTPPITRDGRTSRYGHVTQERLFAGGE